MRVEFWIKSSRGTDQKEEVVLLDDYDDEEIKDELGNWCSNFGAWHVSENYVRYGWRKIKK